jgi:UDP-N-acetyl-D-mannosaminuronate dehydrogenase
MKQTGKIAVVGLGEVGKPLFELISECHEVVGVDIAPVERFEQIEVLHICFPFEISDFIGETARYIEIFRPILTIINSTVAVGTTRTIAERTGAAVVNSPIRGKHARMLDELRIYTKFVGAMDPIVGQQAAKHFESVGLKTKILSSPEATELAKLTETTYFGLLIAWAQEVERYCDLAAEQYDEVVSFYEEIKYLPPVKFYPGIIGRHCVMPNTEILRKYNNSLSVDMIHASNKMKIEREAHKEQERMVASVSRLE